MAKTKYSLDPDYGKPPRWGKLYGKYFPDCTDGWSRHAVMICEDLRDPKSPIRRMLIDLGYEPDHWASSIEVTVQNLWEERRLLAKHAPDFAERRSERQKAQVRKRFGAT